jgi:hypothetical protein
VIPHILSWLVTSRRFLHVSPEPFRTSEEAGVVVEFRDERGRAVHAVVRVFGTQRARHEALLWGSAVSDYEIDATSMFLHDFEIFRRTTPPPGA